MGCVPQDTSRETALVISIIDGDTIDVRINDQVFRVRYIGIDTPERDEAFYSQATAYNQQLVFNKTVIMVKDQSETDQFDRLLRYIIVGDRFVNHELVNQGYATASAYPPDTACASSFETAQRRAQTGMLGLWMPTPVPFVPELPVSGGGNSGNCDPSYPDVCIPPRPPDLDCPQISYTNFTVLPPDPHGFDGDGDGIGCEK
jgi:micrococcal nuclease